MATQIGSGSTTLATYIPDLTDVANIQTALKQLYYGTVAGTLSTTTGIYGALYTLYTGNPTLAGNVTITGDLTVNGTTVTVNVSNLLVEDQEIVLGNVASPSNTTANGGGIRLEAGAGVDKTITWDSTNANWTTSENWNLAAGKALRIGAGGSTTNVISGTATALVLGENATTLTVGPSGNTGATLLNGLTYTFQPTPTTGLTTSQTLTIAQLETLIITTTQTTGSITLTLPAGTSIEGGLPASSPNGTSFEFSIINAGSTGSVLISANSNTLVGLMSVAVSTTGRFRVVKNATNSYTIYRIG